MDTWTFISLEFLKGTLTQTGYNFLGVLGCINPPEKVL